MEQHPIGNPVIPEIFVRFLQFFDLKYIDFGYLSSSKNPDLTVASA
jgi:hypothetical protein